MRLSDKEVKEIVEACRLYFPGSAWKLHLYGSRTDDRSKGGDIDLLLCLPPTIDLEKIRKSKSSLLVEIKKRIGDQRIDFSIKTETQINEDPFWELAMQKAILLHEQDGTSDL